jgi:hypothetical protein
MLKHLQRKLNILPDNSFMLATVPSALSPQLLASKKTSFAIRTLDSGAL